MKSTALPAILAASLVVCASIQVLAQDQDVRSTLAGEWHGSNAGDDDVEFTVRFEPGRAIVTGFRGLGREHRREIQLSYSDAHVTGTDAEGHQFHFLVQSPNRAVLWVSGDDFIAELRRSGQLPPELEGEWRVVEPRRCEADGRTLDIGSSTIRIRDGHRELERPLLVALDDTGRTILGFSESDEDFSEMHEVHPVSEDVWLLRRIDDDDFLVLHRPGQMPAWIGCGVETTEVADPCAAAHERVSTCVQEACATDPENQLCPEQALIEARFSEAECTADMESFARDLARSSCEQIIEALTLGR